MKGGKETGRISDKKGGKFNMLKGKIFFPVLINVTEGITWFVYCLCFIFLYL
jgi:hypothetical protein